MDFLGSRRGEYVLKLRTSCTCPRASSRGTRMRGRTLDRVPTPAQTYLRGDRNNAQETTDESSRSVRLSHIGWNVPTLTRRTATPLGLALESCETASQRTRDPIRRRAGDEMKYRAHKREQSLSIPRCSPAILTARFVVAKRFYALRLAPRFYPARSAFRSSRRSRAPVRA